MAWKLIPPCVVSAKYCPIKCRELEKRGCFEEYFVGVIRRFFSDGIERAGFAHESLFESRMKLHWNHMDCPQ